MVTTVPKRVDHHQEVVALATGLYEALKHEDMKKQSATTRSLFMMAEYIVLQERSKPWWVRLWKMMVA